MENETLGIRQKPTDEYLSILPLRLDAMRSHGYGGRVQQDRKEHEEQSCRLIRTTEERNSQIVLASERESRWPAWRLWPVNESGFDAWQGWGKKSAVDLRSRWSI